MPAVVRRRRARGSSSSSRSGSNDALRRLGPGPSQPVERPRRHECFGRSSTLRHQLRVDALEEHARRRVLAVGDHHRVDDERSGADDVRDVLDLLHDVAVLAEVDRVLEDEDVRVDAEDLLAELLLEAARDAHHDRQRGDAERDAADGERRADGDHVALLRGEVSKRDGDRVTHGRGLANTNPTRTREENSHLVRRLDRLCKVCEE